MRILEAIDGPFQGFVFRVERRLSLVWLRPRYDFNHHRFVPYRVVSIAGDVILRHALGDTLIMREPTHRRPRPS